MSLAEIKKDYPFDSWRQAFSQGLVQYSEENCLKAESILDTLTAGLTRLGLGAPEAAKVSLFEVAVKAFNDLNEETGGSLIETGEREQLFPLFERIASAVGIDTKKYGGGEGIASEWRDW